MLALALALSLVAPAGSAEAPGGELRAALCELDGDATPEDREAASSLLTNALARSGLAVARVGRPPADCGAPCLDHLATKLGAELLLTGTLSSSSGGFSLSLTLFDRRRADAPTTKSVARGADLNALDAALAEALVALIRPALALRGIGPDAITQGLGWGTPGLILGGGLLAAGSMAFLGGLWPVVDRALAASELARLQETGGTEGAVDDAKRRVSAAHAALSDWGMSAVALGAGATLVGAAMMSAAAE
ncbi:MAG: hypothetical protein HYS27_27640 [Deltaproteobacteria bacterium]|nr:hypothetical protein [Deltaproteobacteria bacterium]